MSHIHDLGAEGGGIDAKAQGAGEAIPRHRGVRLLQFTANFCTTQTIHHKASHRRESLKIRVSDCCLKAEQRSIRKSKTTTMISRTVLKNG